MDPDGSHVIPMIPIQAGENTMWSPDGTKALVVRIGDIFVVPALGGTSTNLTNHPASDWSPAWSRDGTRIAFASDRDGPVDLYIMNADGSGVVRIGTGVGMAWKPTWSPDGARLAFTCIVDPVSSPWWSAPTNLDICAINADGSGFARLTSEPGYDSDPDWSPDGARILFAAGLDLVVMNPDGSDVTRINPGVPAGTPSWSSDGTRIAFVAYLLPWDPDAPWMPWTFVSVINADGSGGNTVAWGIDPSWRPVSGGLNDRPVASFTFACSGTTCTLDGLSSSDSDGTIASYLWQFDDGTDASGATVTHTFAGSHNVRLTVMDDDAALATLTQNVNQLPVVAFTTTCSGLTCTFDGSASFDPDGYLYYFSWGFGDWTGRSGKTVTHTYDAAGPYTVTLQVWDSDSTGGASGSLSQTVSVNLAPVASFTSACSELTCSFNASGSSDADGPIASYAWSFGDGTTGSGATVSRTYAVGGSYTVLLTVTDNTATMGTHAQNVTVAPRRVGPRIAYDQCWADANNWEVVCDTHILVDGAETLIENWYTGPKWSPDGSRIAFTNSAYPGEIIVMSLADGSLNNLTNHAAGDWAPAWSRDGRIAFASDREGSVELYVMAGDGSNPTRLTYNAGFNGVFRWSPDGGRIAFSSNRDGLPELYVMAADGSNPTRVTYNVGYKGQPAWSSDGNKIAFGCEVWSGNPDICRINSDGTNFVRLTSDPAMDSGAAFSPVDGRIAFETARFGANSEIAIMEADGSVRRLAAGTGGVQPTWSPDGSRLVFVGTTPSWYSGRCYPEGGAHNADDFCMAMYDIYLVDADGTGLKVIASGANPDWFAPLPGRPEAAFTHDCSVSTCAFDGSGSVDYDGTIATYAWQFGDGTSGSGATPSHTYTRGDRYTATLTVTDDAGATGVVSMSVYANARPSASFTVACAGARCTFDGTGASDSDGTITLYYWLFGDGETGWGPTATHTYATGTFPVSLYVVDNAGGTDIQRKTVSVVNAPPVASFTPACYGLFCTFNGSASADPDGPITIYTWSFGDGTTFGGAPMASRTYAAAGTYTVTLTIGNNHGTGTQSQTVSVTTINAPPVASFTSACVGLACSFNAGGSSDSDGSIASYAWNFGDGTTGSGATASRTYAAGGTYTVMLTVTDNGAATATRAQNVTVVIPPDVHVGDLDRASTIQLTKWTATVTIRVHDSGHRLMANATVSGSWNNGASGSCTTNTSGQCGVSRSGIPKTTSTVSFTVMDVARATFMYKPADNHDPDGDSNGTTVTVTRQ